MNISAKRVDDDSIDEEGDAPSPEPENTSAINVKVDGEKAVRK